MPHKEGGHLDDLLHQLARVSGSEPGAGKECLSRYMACVTSLRRRAVAVDRAGEPVEPYDLVVRGGPG
jgi:hypothetical protein